MATRSSWIGDVLDAGAGPTTIYTCPDGVTALIKCITVFSSDAPFDEDPPIYAQLFHHRAGADRIPVFGMNNAVNPGYSSTDGWFALDAGDTFELDTDGSYLMSIGLYGALLPAAP